MESQCERWSAEEPYLSLQWGCMIETQRQWNATNTKSQNISHRIPICSASQRYKYPSSCLLYWLPLYNKTIIAELKYSPALFPWILCINRVMHVSIWGKDLYTFWRSCRLSISDEEPGREAKGQGSVWRKLQHFSQSQADVMLSLEEMWRCIIIHFHI